MNANNDKAKCAEFYSIPNFPEHYKVNKCGEFLSERRIDARGRNWSRKILKKRKDRYGYLRLRIGCLNFLAHRIVAVTFIENPKNLPFINHKNGIKDDNRIENLEWVSASENNFHKYEVLGYVPYNKGIFGKAINAKKIKAIQSKTLLVQKFNSIAEAGRVLKISTSGISAALRKVQKSAGGYCFEYL